MRILIKYILFDLLRNRVVLAYAMFLLLISLGMFGLQGQTNKALLSLWNLSLLVVPMMSLIFPTIHYYNSYEFIELMLAQPIRRKTLLLSEWLALVLTLSCAYLLGLGLPVLIWSWSAEALWMVGTGVLMSGIFAGVALLIAVITRDKTRGVGISLLSWLYVSLIFDSLVLVFLFYFSEYPLEKAMISLSLFNPVDLARILVVLQMDTAALMGFTGAVFQEFFGSYLGMILVLGSLLIWVSVPVWTAVRVFKQKDL